MTFKTSLLIEALLLLGFALILVFVFAYGLAKLTAERQLAEEQRVTRVTEESE